MRVLFVTQDDPIYVREFFDELFRAAGNRVDIAGVVVAPAMGKHNIAALVLQMWNFYGPVDFFRVAIRYAILRVAALLPELLSGFHSIDYLAARSGVAVRRIRDLNAHDFVEWVNSEDIDVIASVAAPQIFREELIGAARLGCINIHNSPLPRYRGMLPNFWQLLHGEKVAGTTIHRINSKLDDGAILAQTETPILPGESLDGLIRRTKRLGARLMINTLEALRDGKIAEKPNRASEGSYFSFPTKFDVREFRRRGLRLL